MARRAGTHGKFAECEKPCCSLVRVRLRRAKTVAPSDVSGEGPKVEMPTRPCGTHDSSRPRLSRPRYSHAAIEPHATIATCGAGSGWTVFDATPVRERRQTPARNDMSDGGPSSHHFVTCRGGFDRRIARNVGVRKNTGHGILRHKDVPSWQRYAHLELRIAST